MANLIEELVKHNIFKSKAEARSMIKNGGVSVIPSFHENSVPPCFKDKSVEDNIEFMSISDRDFILETKLGLSGQEHQAKIFAVSNIAFYDGFSMMPDGTLFPVRIWDNHGWDTSLARFRENLMNGSGNGIRFDSGWIMTWDISKFGKNPWLVNEQTTIQNELKNGDVVKIGKKRTIVIGE